VYNSEVCVALLPPKQSVEEEDGRYKEKIIPRRPNPGKAIDFSISKIMNRAHRASAIAKPRRTPLHFVWHIVVQINSKEAPLLGYGKKPRRMGSLCNRNPLLGENADYNRC
jgi:hypothetical protein